MSSPWNTDDEPDITDIDDLDFQEVYHRVLGTCCIVCRKRIQTAISCGCDRTYCRRDARQNTHLTRRKTIHKSLDSITYECNQCAGHPNVNLEESSEEKIPTLEMLCAFNIARKMWEAMFEKTRESSLYTRMCSLSIANAVDELFPSLPLPIKNLIKRAVFLLGMELDFFFSHDYEEQDTLIEEKLINKTSRLPACEVDVAKIFTDSGANDGETCWEKYDIEWTPQFTIGNLEY